MIVGVIDLQRFLAVHAVAGDRSTYRPVVIPTEKDSQDQPGDGDAMAMVAFYRRRGVAAMYIADLYAIDGRTRQMLMLPALILAGEGVPVLLDSGRFGAYFCHDLRRRFPEVQHHVSAVIATEWTDGPDDLRHLIGEWADVEPWISLDLADDRPWRAGPGWTVDDPGRFWADVLSIDAPRWIVLDVGAVGTRTGPRGLPAVRRLRAARPEATILLGGGIRDQADVDAARAVGASGVLVATALLDGQRLVWPDATPPAGTAR